MQPARIGVEAAREYWRHPSQQIEGSRPELLPDGPAFQYWACGPICGAFHPALWPGVWMAHYGCKPEGWGRAQEPATAILRAFWQAEQPERVIGWTRADNRLAVAFARRLGFAEDGRMALPSGEIIMQGWRGD